MLFGLAHLNGMVLEKVAIANVVVLIQVIYIFVSLLTGKIAMTTSKLCGGANLVLTGAMLKDTVMIVTPTAGLAMTASI